MTTGFILRTLDASRAIQDEVGRLDLAPTTPPTGVTDLYDALVTDPELTRVTERLFDDGHYAMSVEEAFKCISNSVKAKSGCHEDGAKLMTQVFGEQRPVLRLNSMKTESERNEQKGYMQILAGCMTGIRNPRAHQHGYLDDPMTALKLLAFADHLMRKIDNSRKVRVR